MVSHHLEGVIRVSSIDRRRSTALLRFLVQGAGVGRHHEAEDAASVRVLWVTNNKAQQKLRRVAVFSHMGKAAKSEFGVEGTCHEEGHQAWPTEALIGEISNKVCFLTWLSLMVKKSTLPCPFAPQKGYLVSNI